MSGAGNADSACHHAVEHAHRIQIDRLGFGCGREACEDLQTDIQGEALGQMVGVRFAVEAEIFDDFLGISLAFLEAHREMLRPDAELPFLAEFLMHAVSATANTYGLRAPDRLDDPQLEQAMIEMVERYLLKDDC